MNNLQKMLKDMVIVSIANEVNIEEHSIDTRLNEVKGMPMFATLSDEEIKEVATTIKSEFSIKLDKGILIEEQGHERWFLAKKAQLEMKYWERYKKYLLADKGFSTKVVNTMDDVLDTLTDLLGDPSRDIYYKRRGLIIGDVQSGKTANYTGLICKGVDAGYKVVVLLTGTIEKLRQQTQQRIDEGFVGSDSDAMMKQQDKGLIIGVGKYDSSIRPMVLTSTSDDFKQQNASNLNFDLRNINGSVIFVVKKNSAVLKRLNKWLKTFNQNGEKPIENSVLVIDDEADNASVNTKANAEDTPTAINGQIRELLKMFSKSSYVGFTATPFANIFIDPENYNAMVAEDLFPKDYIYSLNAPSNYIGARNIFDEDGRAGYMLEEIDDNVENPESIAFILPLRHKSSVQVRKLPEDLKTAVAAFMLANTVEDIRGMEKNHRSMLINVSRFTAVQEQIAELVNEYVKEIQSACRLYCKLDVDKAIQDERIAKLKDTYELIYPEIALEWEKVQHELHNSCAGIIVQTINQRNGKNLSYEEYKDGLRLIAVGGMSLSRGLTLEGLVISYFYRNSKMYDTLMQMGRWFGYRKGYDDLCRIWMSDESIEWYRHISQATDELRDEIKRYEDTGLTPMDFGLRVRSDITSLIVTARNKMRSAESRECVISLSGAYIETPEIYSDIDKNRKNYETVRRFVEELLTEGYKVVEVQKKETVKYGFKGIPMIKMLDLLERLDVSPKNEQFNVKAIEKFIRNYKGKELKEWDISFATGKGDKGISFSEQIKYKVPTRKYSVENGGKILKMSGSKRRLGTSADGQFGLTDKQLEIINERSSKKNIPQKDYFINVDRNPLLTIYAVELKDADGDMSAESIKIQNACKDEVIMGFGVGIPTLSDQETKYARYILNKIAIQQIFEGDIDDWNADEEEGDD
ncbi:MAG: Z1 domain-containing protein [Lachnospiraceae bacterium]|nr:Z1 domain-containing protein [Lachnospiraceae bacterium]